MAQPLTDGITALTAYANTVTGASDQTLSDAVATLASGYGGGSSSWTKVAEKTYTVNTTSTSAATTDTFATGHSEIWTSANWVYVRVRDTQGKRSGYFYGSDTFFYNIYVASGATSFTSLTDALRIIKRSINNEYSASPYTSTTGYGVYADTIYNDGRVRIRQRYSSSYSLTVNSTYKVEVYILTPPDNIPIFEQ